MRSAMGVYVFSVFTSTSESNMYIYTSDDALNFSLLKGPAYIPTTGLIRDPSIIRHTDDNYYVSYTTNWEGRDFAIARSSNLLDWTLHTTVTIPNTLITRTWAPEIFQDPHTGNASIIVSLGQTLSTFNAYMYTATDSTLTAWTGPVLMTGIGPNYIDTFVVWDEESGLYHAYTKNESTKYLEHATASNLAGPWTFVQTGNFAGFGRAEGPCITTLEDGTYRLFADGYDSGKYIYSDSPDLYTWSTFQEVPGGLSGFIRHGTVRNMGDGPL
ncbi:arabinosidase [Morchella snyderi]|nr:arabinosidase [Morchella snyderi]